MNKDRWKQKFVLIETHLFVDYNRLWHTGKKKQKQKADAIQWAWCFLVQAITADKFVNERFKSPLSIILGQLCDFANMSPWGTMFPYGMI